jgi:hypothetical protein
MDRTAIVLALRGVQQIGTVHKQLPQVAVASLADAEESGLAAGRVLARHKSQSGGEFSALVEGRSVADRSDDRGCH